MTKRGDVLFVSVIVGSSLAIAIGLGAIWMMHERDKAPVEKQQANAAAVSDGTAGEPSHIAAPRGDEIPQTTDSANKHPDEASTASTPPAPPAPTYSDSLIDIESITIKPYYGGAILVATVHNKSPDTLDTIVINVNCFDENGVQTDNASFVFHDLAPNTTAVKDMTGALNAVPARVQIVRVTHI
jgi:hypothetical protein